MSRLLRLSCAVAVAVSLVGCTTGPGAEDSESAPDGWVRYVVDDLPYDEPVSVELVYPQGWDVAVDSEDLEGTEAVAEFYRVLDDGTTYGQISVFADGELGASLRARDVLRALMMEYAAEVDEFEVVMQDEIEVAGADEALVTVLRLPAVNNRTGEEYVRERTEVVVQVTEGAVVTLRFDVTDEATETLDREVFIDSLRVNA